MTTPALRNRQAPPDSDCFGIEMLPACLHGEVILYTLWGSEWLYGIVTSPGTKLMSVYDEISPRGVPSVLYATSPHIDGRFQFRLARPDEFEGVKFSSGHGTRH